MKSVEGWAVSEGAFSAFYGLQEFTSERVEEVERDIRSRPGEYNRVNFRLDGISFLASLERDGAEARVSSKEEVVVALGTVQMRFPRTRNPRSNGFVVSCPAIGRKVDVSEITVAFRPPDDILIYQGVFYLAPGPRMGVYFILNPEFNSSDVSLATLIAEAEKAIREKFAALFVPVETAVCV